MRNIIQNIVGILVVIVLNGFGFVGHTVAMPMHGMNHEQTSSANCAILCRTVAVESKQLKAKETQKENDNEPFIPFYLQLQNQRIDASPSVIKSCQPSIRLPLKVPIYILYGVFRV